jgi:hypothetical protein
VRARSEGSPLGGWSEIRRFQIASQSERVKERTIGDPTNQLIIADDLVDTADDNFELTSLYATQDTHYWYFGFNARHRHQYDRRCISAWTTDGSGAHPCPRHRHHLPAHRRVCYIQPDRIRHGQPGAVYGWNGGA